MKHFDHHARLALIVACVMLAVCGVGFNAAMKALNIWLKKEPVELRLTLSSIPKVLGEWRTPDGMQDGRISAEIAESLGTNIYLDRRYERIERRGRQYIDVHISYYTGMIDAVPHVPERCIVVSGWDAAGLPTSVPLYPDGLPWTLEDDTRYHHGNPDLPYQVLKREGDSTETVIRMPIGDLALRITEFTHVDQPGIRLFAGYLFITNGETVSTPELVRAKAFDRHSRHAYFAKVQFSMSGDRKLERSDFVDATADLMTELLPELMLCLPDWSDTEPADPGASTS